MVVRPNANANTSVCYFLQKLELDRFMLYAHGPDLCRESDLRHAMANCFEALIGMCIYAHTHTLNTVIFTTFHIALLFSFTTQTSQ